MTKDKPNKFEGKVFDFPIKTFDSDKLLEEMKTADSGTIFVLGEEVIKYPEGEYGVTLVCAKIFRGKDTPYNLKETKEKQDGK